MFNFLKISFLSLTVPFFIASAQEFRIMDDPILYYTYDKYDKTIYYRDYFTGEIYKTDINGTYKEYFLPGEFIHFNFFNNNHTLALLKYIENQEPKRELYFFDFDKDTLIFKIAKEPFSALDVTVSPNDENILFNNEELSHYSIIDDTLKIAKSNILPIDNMEWRSDSSFFFLSRNLYQYNFSDSTIDTLIEHQNEIDAIISMAYNRSYNILAYSYVNPDGINQVLLKNLSTGTETIAYDENDDIESGIRYISNLKWSPDQNKLVFIIYYWTTPVSSDILVFNYTDDTWKRYTDWSSNYGARDNVMWLNQDTILYDYNFQLFAFDFTKATAIEEEPKSPEIFDLSIINYPNPFNASTNIEITFPQYLINANMHIDVYNTSGQHIQQLNRYQRKDNKVIFYWNSQNSKKYISSGVYLLSIFIMENGKKRKLKTHKVILLK